MRAIFVNQKVETAVFHSITNGLAGRLAPPGYVTIYTLVSISYVNDLRAVSSPVKGRSTVRFHEHLASGAHVPSSSRRDNAVVFHRLSRPAQHPRSGHRIGHRLPTLRML